MFRIVYRPGEEYGEHGDPQERICSSGDLQQTIDTLRSQNCLILSVGEIFRSLEDVFLSATSGDGS